MFNWFRRKFDDKEKAEKQSVETTEVTPQEETITESESATEATLEAEEVKVESEPTKTQPEEIKTKSAPVAEVSTEEVKAESAPATTPQDDYLAWAKAAYQNIQQRKEAEEEKSRGGEEAEEIEEVEANGDSPTENVPAWMRKSAGLEKLKETSIEVPTEELRQTTISTSAIDDLAFDEDFLWAAKTLAAQGRNPDEISEEEINWLKQLRQGLGKTRRSLINQLKAVVGQGPLNDDAVMEIEALLLQADVGIEATEYIIDTLQEKLREEALPPEEAIAYLKTILQEILDSPLRGQDNQDFVPAKDTLNIWLLTGVNGAGKTTTVGKLAHMAKTSGYECLIAAADTFRAAAVEQVKVWGERSSTPVIANPGKNTDPAAVVFDAIAAAQSRQTELLLVDTAGRLQNKKNLMEELAKIRRIIDKKTANAQVESLLVLDATLGQNGLRQAQVFSEAAKLSGVVLTKLDGTAKGGVAIAVAKQLNLPIRFIGAGEGIEDLRPFSSYEFVEALLN
ncbi:MAG: signal recognition particle-docking protein FtsY [Xenococcaceae cyanobacterium MO_188.B29]|nr:signal recognition particle-docking protein FtsY [Xenococcaceae cyanobacterium MO_188.B29]